MNVVWSKVIRLSYLSLCVALFNSCAIATQEISLDSGTQETSSATTLEYAETVLLENSEYAIIPVGFATSRGYLSIISSYSQIKTVSSSKIANLNNMSLVNLVFHHKTNADTYLLLERKAFISQFDYLFSDASQDGDRHSCTSKSESQIDTNLFIYKIVLQDSNQNGLLDNDDATLGYISDLSGKNLRAITPQNTQLLNWECDSQHQQLVLFVKEDSNRNRQYTDSDATAAYLYNLTSNSLQRITPEHTSIAEWKLDFADNFIFLEIQSDTDKNQQFNQYDRKSVLKFNLKTAAPAREITTEEIRNQIKSLNSN